MEKMSLFKRFIGSAIDKMIILVLFVIIYLIIDSHATGKLIYYVLNIMKFSPSLYQYAGEVDVSYTYFGFYNEGTDFFQKYYTPDMYEGMVRAFDLKLTFGFILLNVVYYLACELKLKASLGKYMLGGILVDSFEDKITTNDIFIRAFSAAILMALFVGIRFLFDTNYYWTILFFFLVIDIPVFINGISLIDRFAKVRYIKRSEFDKSQREQEESTVEGNS